MGTQPPWTVEGAENDRAIACDLEDIQVQVFKRLVESYRSLNRVREVVRQLRDTD